MTLSSGRRKIVPSKRPSPCRSPFTTKHGQLEDAATVEARIHEAAAYVPLERLALSPQCGFASVEAGNPLTPDEQAAKLRLVAEVARRVW